MDCRKKMFEIIKNQIFSTGSTIVTDEAELREIYELSKHHDLSQIIGNEIIEKDLLPDGELKDKYSDAVYTAVIRYSQTLTATEDIRKLFNEEKVDFILLKGAVIRGYYPEPWMRTSCDIDILIKKEELKRVKKAIIEKLGYKYYAECAHDISFVSEDNIKLELHYLLIEENRIKSMDRPLRDIWNHTEKLNGNEYKMTDEVFYYYHICHMAKHFHDGGCGIKPILDLALIKRADSSMFGKSEKLLEAGGILQFAESCEKLADIWFGTEGHDELTKTMEDYIINGGTYGSLENNVVSERAETSGKIGYVIKKIFKPYKEMIIRYPVLKNHKYLLPVYEFIRWINIIFGGRLKKSVAKLHSNAMIDDDVNKKYRMMFDRLYKYN